MLVLSACDTQQSFERPFKAHLLPRDSTLIVGTWDLVWHGHPWSGERPYQGPPRTYVFDPEGQFSLTLGEEVIDSGRYWFEEMDCNAEGECRHMLYTDGRQRWDWSGADRHWLAFIEGVDGFIWGYWRR